MSQPLQGGAAASTAGPPENNTMKQSTLLAVGLLAAAAALPCLAQDLAMTAGKGAKVILDNDKVRVIELTVAPEGSTGLHSHGDHIVYFLTAGEAKQTTDGKTTITPRKPGEILWSGPVTHETVNGGKAETRTLIIELKSPAR
jgi:quercetin dioxygenase-like cupin family protein